MRAGGQIPRRAHHKKTPGGRPIRRWLTHRFDGWTQCRICYGWYDDPRHLQPIQRGQSK